VFKKTVIKLIIRKTHVETQLTILPLKYSCI